MPSLRAGGYRTQIGGYQAFLPKDLPPDPPLRIDPALSLLLSKADQALGRLDGVATMLPDPDLFVAMFVRHEAVLSSQIEGTQSSLGDLLEFEAAASASRPVGDVAEVVNYVRAMNHGLSRLNELPLCTRLVREIHAELLSDVRGDNKHPGDIQISQNWIGSAGADLRSADFVPPPPGEVPALLSNLEQFIHDRETFPDLIQCGIAHAQFETIHPFLDGNGRVGRLLITFMLCERKILNRPLLYLSSYLKAHRQQYYDRLTAIRNDGDWEGWLAFFLRGVLEVSQAATAVAREILRMREGHRIAVESNTKAQRLLEHLVSTPLIAVRHAAKYLSCTTVTAGRVIESLEGAGVLREITGRERGRVFVYGPYLDLFDPHMFRSPAAKTSTKGNIATSN